MHGVMNENVQNTESACVFSGGGGGMEDEPK